jgi:lysozyme family protein
MQNRFEECLKLVLVHEGGYVNHPKDPGGATNKGVTQRVYDGWRTKKGQPKRSVREITDTEVSSIYRAQYWDLVNGDDLPAGVDYVVFDGAVNSGVGQSVKWLQRSLPEYRGPIDGDIGAGTMGAIAVESDAAALVDRICDRRMAFLKALKTWGTFGRGWSRRVEGVRKAGKAMVEGKAAPKAAFVEDGNRNAVVEDAQRAPGKGVADAATGGGLGAGGLAVTVGQLQEQLTPYSVAGNWIGNLVVGLVILSAVLTIGGLAYRFYANKRKGEQADALDLQPVSK